MIEGRSTDFILIGGQICTASHVYPGQNGHRAFIAPAHGHNPKDISLCRDSVIDADGNAKFTDCFIALGSQSDMGKHRRWCVLVSICGTVSNYATSYISKDWSGPYPTGGFLDGVIPGYHCFRHDRTGGRYSSGMAIAPLHVPPSYQHEPNARQPAHHDTDPAINRHLEATQDDQLERTPW